ncbi:hypothetical protein [Massilia glaciei]|uniref:hypothetical protein n=1 Tax=Massilia glaciei TaxID=1524097 RepID=UPI001C637C22|nr:hypothetical protein [Massilia glaciei]
MQESTHRLPGLDLLRALAVGAVMLYHLDGRFGVALPAFVRHGHMGTWESTCFLC